MEHLKSNTEPTPFLLLFLEEVQGVVERVDGTEGDDSTYMGQTTKQGHDADYDSD